MSARESKEEVVVAQVNTSSPPDTSHLQVYTATLIVACAACVIFSAYRAVKAFREGLVKAIQRNANSNTA